jgi:hypothetical protein
MNLFLTSILLALLLILVPGQVLQYSFSQNATNQTGLLPIPELQPRDESVDSDGEDTGTISEPEPEPVTDRFAAQIEFEPNEDLGLEDYYEVSNFALTVMESSELCPTGNCEFELEGGEIGPQYTPGERILTGKLRIDTGDSSKIMDVFGPWETIEERTGEDGETVQVVEGTFGIGRNPIDPDFEYRINGTMTSDGDNYLVALHGER